MPGADDAAHHDHGGVEESQAAGESGLRHVAATSPRHHRLLEEHRQTVADFPCHPDPEADRGGRHLERVVVPVSSPWLTNYRSRAHGLTARRAASHNTQPAGCARRMPAPKALHPSRSHRPRRRSTRAAALRLHGPLNPRAPPPCDQLHHVSLPAGGLLFRQGESGDAVYFVVAGHLTVVVTRDDGRRSASRSRDRANRRRDGARLRGAADRERPGAR